MAFVTSFTSARGHAADIRTFASNKYDLSRGTRYVSPATHVTHILPRMCTKSAERAPSFQRRSFLQLAVLSISGALVPSAQIFAEETEPTRFSTYLGPISLGFSFLYPSNWTVKKKPIKTHLSEIILTSKTDSATSAGLVVDAVKISAIEKFGTPEDVGKKVINIETQKTNVNSASVQSASSEAKNGLTYYVIDYTVDSSRGAKRYVAKATVTGGQLYVFTMQAKTDHFDAETENAFTKMLDSFNVKKQYL